MSKAPEEPKKSASAPELRASLKKAAPARPLSFRGRGGLGANIPRVPSVRKPTSKSNMPTGQGTPPKLPSLAKVPSVPKKASLANKSSGKIPRTSSKTTTPIGAKLPSLTAARTSATKMPTVSTGRTSATRLPGQAPRVPSFKPGRARSLASPLAKPAARGSATALATKSVTRPPSVRKSLSPFKPVSKARPLRGRGVPSTRRPSKTPAEKPKEAIKEVKEAKEVPAIAPRAGEVEPAPAPAAAPGEAPPAVPKEPGEAGALVGEAKGPPPPAPSEKTPSLEAIRPSAVPTFETPEDEFKAEKARVPAEEPGLLASLAPGFLAPEEPRPRAKSLELPVRAVKSDEARRVEPPKAEPTPEAPPRRTKSDELRGRIRRATLVAVCPVHQTEISRTWSEFRRFNPNLAKK